MGVVNLESEIENKYELFEGSIDEVIERVSAALYGLKEEWNFEENPEKSERHVNYYDTYKKKKGKGYLPTFEVYSNGQTIREVTGYEDGSFRYDYKKGKLEKRKEANLESANKISEEEILRSVPRELKRKWANKGKGKIELRCTASADVKHVKWNLEKDGTKIELKLDFFDIYEGGHLRELELEIKRNGKGGKQYLKSVSEHIQQSLGLKRIYEQKYTTITNSLTKYQGILPKQK